MSTRGKCLNHPDAFCYICGGFTIPGQRANISEFVKQAYLAYFKVKLGDQDKAWAPHIVCKSCRENLRQWTKGTRQKMSFGIPMIWREQRNHLTDCYFCIVKTSGYNKKNKQSIDYPYLESALRPVEHSETVPVPIFESLPSLELEEMEGACALQSSSSDEYTDPTEFSKKDLFNQLELNDLMRDLNLSKMSSELLASRLKERSMLQKDTRVTFYRRREECFLPYFSEERGLVYCQDVESLLSSMGVEVYDQKDWRLFIDSSKRSLKCVLLHNGNEYGSIPIFHSVQLVEKYEHIKTVLELIRYHEHQWIICVDLKMVNFLLGQQGGYTKYPCFLCLWDSRADNRHWVQRSWPERTTLEVGGQNIINQPLVEREKIVLPPLHIKLGLKKQFVKALNADGDCFRHICATQLVHICASATKKKLVFLMAPKSENLSRIHLLRDQ